MKALLAALQFLTVVPVRGSFSDADRARSLLAFPVVGLMIGVALTALLSVVSATPQLGAVLAVVAMALISGGLHLDGLADSADAWAARRSDPADTLRIMRDPNCGPIGATAIALVLIAKFAALSALLAADNWAVLLVAPMLGRTAALALFASTPYVRSGGLGSAYSEHLDRFSLWAATAIVAFIAMLVAGLTAILAVALLLVGLRTLMLRRIGGATGDTMGASIELTETCLLLSAAVLHSH